MTTQDDDRLVNIAVYGESGRCDMVTFDAEGQPHAPAIIRVVKTYAKYGSTITQRHCKDHLPKDLIEEFWR